MKPLFLAPLSLALAHLATADVHVMNAQMDGAHQVPPVATAGMGEAVLTVDDVSGRVHVQGTFSNLAGNPQAAHLHGLAAAGSNAGVLFALTLSGSSFEGTAVLAPAQVAGVLDGQSYINVHTNMFPAGEIRGQGLFEPITYTGGLDGTQAGSGSPGTGSYTVDIDRNTNLITVSGSYSGLQGNVIASHLHGPAWFGQSAGLVFGLMSTGGTTGTFMGSSTVSDANLDHILDGFTYINLHSSMNPGGEVRGQVSPDSLGTPYCRPEANSTGVTGQLRASGSPRAMDNDVTLDAMDLPLNSFGFVIASRSSGQTFPVTNSQGRICVVGPNIGRIGSTIQSSGAIGTMSASIDIMNIPGNPPQSAMAGDVFNFQVWHRDATGGMPTSNFTNAVSISFR